LGLTDSFRLFEQAEKSFTWWDYRMHAFRRNLGLRIDHILLSGKLAQSCSSCVIDTVPRKLERPSDHTPIIAEIAPGKARA
jgi:exodeoxyribonuclease-3